MDMLNWAKHETELAVKGIDPKDEYTRACYDSALRALKSLLEDGHSGFSISVTRHILDRLIQRKPLTPIEDTPDVWEECGWAGYEADYKMFQCSRMSSLFKHVYPDGTVRYTDVERTRVYNLDDPTVPFLNGQITRLIDEMFPIAMPYCPSDRPMRVIVEEFLVDPANGDYDTTGVFDVTDQDGVKHSINRYFTECGADDGSTREITAEEYAALKAQALPQDAKGPFNATN